MDRIRLRRQTIIMICTTLMMSSTTQAAFTFDSNGTDADGAWTLNSSDCPSINTPIVLDVGSSGVKQFSSISIHQNCRVTFTPAGGSFDSFSNPVRLIVSGDVTINGILDLDGEDGTVSTSTSSVAGGQGGSGGFDGGRSGLAGASSNPGGSGYGPGGGYGTRVNSNSNCSSAARVGLIAPAASNIRNQLLIGGSGGGGGCKYVSHLAGGGGGGGGALMVATSGTIIINGTITALGGNGGYAYSSAADGKSGSDGMVYLIANRIEGSGAIHASRSVVETLDYSGELTSSSPLSQIEFQRLEHSLTPAAQLQVSQIDGQTITTGAPLILSAAGEVTLQITSSGLSEGTAVEVIVTNSRLYNKSTATTNLDVYGNGSVTMTLESGVMSVLTYVTEGS